MTLETFRKQYGTKTVSLTIRVFISHLPYEICKKHQEVVDEILIMATDLEEALKEEE